MSALLSLTALLVLLGAPSIQGSDNYSVAFRTDGPEGIYGIACHEMFEAVEGHSQALCGDLPSGTVLLYVDEIPDRRTLLSVIRHEAAHFELGVNPHGRTPWERFNEAVAYRLGDIYAMRAIGDER